MWKYIAGGAGAIVVGTALYCVKKYFAGGVCRCTRRLDGLVIIITGATSGIGKALAYLLAERGAVLILASRNVEKANIIKDHLQKLYQSQVYVKKLDLNSLDSISKFSNYVNDEFQKVYALINNAGVFYHPHQLTEDEFDITFQTNYLGPFVLTHCLLQSLKKSEQARIINVVSEAHRLIQFQDLVNVTNSQSFARPPIEAYAVSKLGLVLFTKKLAKEVSDKNILVNAVNPGNVETDLYRHFPFLNNALLFALLWFIRIIVVKRPLEGAQTVLHAVLTKDTSTGNYMTDCKIDLPCQIASDEQKSEEYYNLTLNLLKDNWISPDEKILKEIIISGRIGLKPTENSKCYINVTDCDSDLSALGQTRFYVLGESDSEIYRLLDNCLMMMHSGEIAKVTFDLGSKHTFTIELVNFEIEELVHEWNAQKKYNLAVKHKTRGVELFHESHFIDASYRFGKGLKLLCSIPVEINPPFTEIDGVSLQDINNLKLNLYNNLASCFLRCHNYHAVSNLCQKIFETDNTNIKALYKYGLAMCELQDYEKSQNTFLALLKIDPDNKAAAAKLKFVNAKVAQTNVKVNEIFKKMFSN
ncbi:hypothetical protein FQR65_LT11000 [Abscondita terminalis]|nr:hypothetical protein FQR65_LT11000 [Abscondita terminalis]